MKVAIPDAPGPRSTELVRGLRALAAVAEEVAAETDPLDGSTLEFWGRTRESISANSGGNLPARKRNRPAPSGHSCALL